MSTRKNWTTGKILVAAGGSWGLLCCVYAFGFMFASICDECAYDPVPLSAKMLPMALAGIGLVVMIAGLIVEALA